MDYRNVRAGIQQAKLGRLGTGFLAVDAIACGILAGTLSHSWMVGIAIFIVATGSTGALARALPPHWITPLTGAMSLIWTATAALVAYRTGGEPVTVTAVALCTGTLGYIAHHAGFLSLHDVERDDG